MKAAIKQQGATLMEIMVSIVVMAIGLLGLASLQMNALKYQKTASQRSEAIQAAYDLGERMRANWVFTTQDKYAAERTANEANYTYKQDYATTIANNHKVLPNNCQAVMTNPAGCTAAQIAQNDITQWLRSIEVRLAGGSGFIVPVTGAANSTFDVTVMWKEQGLTTTDPACPGDAGAPVGVRCFTIRYTV